MAEAPPLGEGSPADLAPETTAPTEDAAPTPDAQEKPTEETKMADPKNESDPPPAKMVKESHNPQQLTTSASKPSSSMSFAKKMAQRAKPFDLPISDNMKKELHKEKIRQETMSKEGTIPEKRGQEGILRRTFSGGGGGGTPKKQKQDKKQERQKQQQSKQSKKEETPLLPKEEIEKRLARAQKYGTMEGADELKAMLRKHWFNC